jgi:hypothetical protein
LQELLVARAAAKANVLTLAEAIAFAEVEAVSDTNFERRKQAIALRRGLVGQAAALMASATNGLAATGADSLRAATNAVGAFGESRARVRSDPGFYNTTGQRLRMGADGEAEIAPSALDEMGFGDLRLDNPNWAPPGGSSSLLSGAQSTGTMSAGRLTTASGALNGGQQQNLVRSGTMTFITPAPGTPVTLNLSHVPLTSGARYLATREQNGPSPLPGPPTPLVTYGGN